MSKPVLSRPVLEEILKSFVHAETLPTDDALQELGKASGLRTPEVKAEYARLHVEEGHQGDPWVLPGD